MEERGKDKVMGRRGRGRKQLRNNENILEIEKRKH
jgi:hypothetical protein